MNEEEKMLAGEFYNANYDDKLLEKRLKTKELCKKFNECDVRKIDEKKNILEELFQKKIDVLGIEPNFYCDYGFNIYLGKNFYSNHNLVILDANRVEFGDNVVIGAGLLQKDVEKIIEKLGKRKLIKDKTKEEMER